MKLILITILVSLAVSKLTAQNQTPFNFIYEVGTDTRSISGIREGNGDYTDSIQLFLSDVENHRILTEVGGVLSVPVTIASNEAVFIEVGTGAAAYILGEIPPLYLDQQTTHQQFSTAANMGFYFMLLLALAWYARHT